MRPRIYTYKITFIDTPYYYYGVHKEKRFNEYYWGTPATNKWCWEFYEPEKQILEFFEYSDEGWLKAQEIEKQLIKPFFNTDKWCLNENCGGIISLEVLRKSGKRNVENKIGIFSLPIEELSKFGKRGGSIGGKIAGMNNKLNGTGFFKLSKEERIKNAKIAGNRCKELGVGAHALTLDQKRKIQKISVEKQKKNNIGIFGLTKERKKEIAIKCGEKNKILFAKSYAFLSPTGELFEGINISQFCREQNLLISMMSCVRNGKRNHHKGWTRAYAT